MRRTSLAVCAGVGALLLAPRAEADPPKIESTFEKPEPKPKSPGDRVSLQLEDVELPELVRAMSELTGKRFLLAAQKVKGFKTTIVSQQKITVAEAYQAFLASLQANGLTVLPEGGVHKIVESQDVTQKTTPITRDGEDLSPEERYVTRVHRLKHVPADESTTQLLQKFQTKEGSIVPYAAGNLLIVTDTGANLRRLMRILDEIDVPAPEAKLWFQPLRFAAAADVEKKLSDLFELKGGKDARADPRLLRIVPVDRPNALVVVATEEGYRRVLALLEHVDVPPQNEAQIQVVRLSYADAKKIALPLAEVLGSLGPQGAGGKSGAAQIGSPLEGPAKVGVEESTNALIVTSSPRDFLQIREVIRALDQPKRQVYLECVILDLTVEKATSLGLAFHGGDGVTLGAGEALAYGAWRGTTSVLAPTASDLQAFALGIRGPDIKLPFSIPTGTGSSIDKIPGVGALLVAQATNKSADVLSTPHVIASDNTAAELRVQLNTSLQPNAPPAATVLAGTSLAGAGTSASSNYRAIGPKIKLTPHLNESDKVRLDLEETISDVASTPDKSDTYGTVSFIDREAKTTLTIPDGETFVIGGLVRNRRSRAETKVPLLGDIPLLGALFRTSTDTNDKSNLVLLITPHILRDESDMKRVFEEKMHERRQLADHIELFQPTQWEPPTDWSKKRGLLGDIRAKQRAVAAPPPPAGRREVGPPQAVAPIDLPAPLKTWGSPATPSATPATPTVSAPRLERVER